MAKDNPSGALNVLALTAVDLCTMLLRAGVDNLTPSAIGKWVQLGCPRNADKTYNMPKVLAWFVNERAKIPHRPPAETDALEKAKLADLLERTRARRQARRLAAGELAQREDIHEEWMRLLHGVNSGLTTLARVLVKEVAGQPEPAVKQRVEERVNDVLRTFAEGWDGGTEPKGNDHEPNA